MSAVDVIAGLLIAAAALYALGLPLAWLLPAPAHSTWVLRIAVAPLYSILVAFAAAKVLGWVGIRMHPVQLGALLALAWGAAWLRTGHDWRLREALGRALGPFLMIAVSGVLWAMSLAGFGLYLPNEDFKNHAYFVAQVAWTRSADTSLILRASPLSAPEPATFYPLGLHVLLGWAVPTTGYSTVAVTAAAAVLVAAISVPLAVIALARTWNGNSELLWWVAGFASVGFVGLSNGFGIGSVVLLAVTGLYAAGLAVLWEWVHHPRVLAAAGLLACGMGLLVLHVAEAVGLGLVTVACLPIAWRARSSQRIGRRSLVMLLLVGVAGALAAGLMLRRLMPLLNTDLVWDLQPNLEGPVTAALVAAGQEPGGSGWGRAIWVALGVVGFTVAARRGWSPVPLVAFLVPVAVGTVAGLRGVPQGLSLLTAPWYGSAGRVGLMAMAPIAVAGSLALVWLRETARTRALLWVADAVVVACVALLAAQVVPARRAELRTSLAGAGDTAHVARWLQSTLQPGETVLNFNRDGTANLFAFARLPVTAGWFQDNSVAEPTSPGGVPVVDQLLRLDEPEVRARLEELKVAYIAVGTTSRYWGTETGYLWQALITQPELSLALTGSDMVVLRYSGSDVR